MQRRICAIWNRNEVVRAKRLPASVAVELIAAGTQQFSAGGISARVDFEEGVAAVFVVLNGKTLEQRIASGTRSGSESWSHVFIMHDPLKHVK